MNSPTTTDPGLGTERTAPSRRPPLLQVDDLRCHIPTRRGLLRAVDGVPLTLDRGQTLGIAGESGSGKSMLVRTIMGIAPRSAEISGSVHFDGVDLRALPAQKARTYLGRHIAMVFQDPMTALNPVVRIE